ncbi:UNVERIFIED_CONTAM: E3 ubiquitin-protein ligase SPL2 [Sesamum angustifolium]|uniref:RING-type E3 ubiquitin transferase n=1 Tax=Sesamum angustifolium TaxID=2727405 RepID=A0AAW2LK01_9LAMI
MIEALLSFYFSFSCNLVQCSVDLDDQTTMHFWGPAHRKFSKPNLVMIHGYGGNSRWQFVYQVAQLAESFNLYIPDLLFFGKSHTNCTNRSETFQAECVVAGLKRLGVERCSVYGISYGGYVGYRMAEIYSEMVEKVVIVSSGVGCTEDQKGKHLKSLGVDILDLLLPEKPEGVRLLVEKSVYRSNPFKWAPDFILQEFVDVPFILVEEGKWPQSDYLVVNMEGSRHPLPLMTVYQHLQPINASPYTFLQALFGLEYPVGLLYEEKILPLGKDITAVGICNIKNGIPEIKSCKDLPYFLNWIRWKEWRYQQRAQQQNNSTGNEAQAEVAAEEESGDVPDGELCVICLMRRRRSAFIPCGHLVCCQRCALSVEREVLPKCPVCRQPIRSSVRIYDS